MDIFVKKHPNAYTLAETREPSVGEAVPDGFEIMSRADYAAWRDAEITGGWQPAAPPEQTLGGLIDEIERAVQSALDNLARGWGYDSSLSCASYAASTIPQFAAEAAALIAWRDSLWTACYAAQESFDPNSALPTVEEFVSSLPTAPPRPTT